MRTIMIGAALAHYLGSAAAVHDPRIFDALRSIKGKYRGGPGRRSVLSLHRRIGHGIPHQGQRECARRMAQVEAGQIRFHTIAPTGTDKGKNFARAKRRLAEKGLT